MPHPLVSQLRFARSEFWRGLEGVSDEEAGRRIPPMNCISWIVGHLANQEQSYWLRLAQRKTISRELDALFSRGRPASTPPLAEMRQLWQAITAAADPYLDSLTTESLEDYYKMLWRPVDESVGTLFYRMIYHYWYHLGEAMAVRQLLGHEKLPDFVGRVGAEAPYRVERGA